MSNLWHIARDFLHMITVGQIDQAFAQYVSSDFVHHNQYTPAGRSALISSMIQNHEQFPHKQLSILHCLQQWEMVMVHSCITLEPRGQEIVVVHIFKFQEHLIVEMRDVGQPVIQTS
jgi:predicted SnoaL-like aldol condensation-catalyzing enzyme